MHIIIWRYRVASDCVTRFEEAYGSAGSWARLFRPLPGYHGTDLVRGVDGSYVTIDRWESEEAWRAGRAQLADAYVRMDAACDALTLEEEKVAAGESVSDEG